MASLLLPLTALTAPVPASTQLIGTDRKCDGGRLHTIEFNVSMNSSKFIDMDGDLGEDLKKVDCDLDGTRLLFTFKVMC